MKTLSTLLLGLSVLALSGCYGMNEEIKMNGRYWQRIDTTDAIYQRGPKAQQMLFQDQANCTATINEMQRLGAVRNAVPGETFDKDYMHTDPDGPTGRMANYESPKRDGYMRLENYDYHDFETCMNFKGWERTKYASYETRERARNDYLDAIGYQRYRTMTNEKVQSDYSRLNQ